MPPEMLRYGRMSSAVDMYSYGIMSKCYRFSFPVVCIQVMCSAICLFGSILAGVRLWTRVHRFQRAMQASSTPPSSRASCCVLIMMNCHQCRALMFSSGCVCICSAVWEAFTGQPAFRHLHYGEQQPGHRGTPHTGNPCVKNSERPAASTLSCWHRFWAACLACLSSCCPSPDSLWPCWHCNACCCAGQFFECIVLNDMRPNVPEDMPRDYSMLMLACWSTNPADRPTADRVLEVLQLMVQERQAVLAEAQHHGVWLQGEGQRDDTAVHPHPASEGSHAQGAHSAESAGSSGQGRGVGGGAGCRAPAGPGGLGVQGPLDGSSSGGSSLLLPV